MQPERAGAVFGKRCGKHARAESSDCRASDDIDDSCQSEDVSMLFECGEEDGLCEMVVGSGLFNGQAPNGYDSSGLEEPEMIVGHVPNSIGVVGCADARISDVAPPAAESIDTPAGSLAPHPA